MMGDESLSAQDKVKLKVSFAEGYMVAANELKKSGASSFRSKMFSIAKNVLLVVLLAISLGFLSFGGTER